MTSGPSTEGSSTPLDENLITESLAEARQEIERLTDLLRSTQGQLDQSQRLGAAGASPTPDPNLATLVDTLVQTLGRTSGSPAPAAPAGGRQRRRP